MTQLIISFNCFGLLKIADMKILRTSCKNPISKSLSYPLGAKRISEAVDGISQFDQTSLYFLDSPVGGAMHFERILRDRNPYLVLECSLYADGESYLDGITSWRISVYPVLRALKAAASDALAQSALPQLREFLSETANLEYTITRSHLKVVFDPMQKSISLKSD